MNTGKKPLRLLIVLLISSFLAACGPEEKARLRPLGGDAVVLAFGDSITYGTGAARGEAYPDVLAKLTGLAVINAGVPGELSAAGRARLGELLDLHRPALVLLCHGGNDILRRLSGAEMKGNLEAMIEAARTKGADVVLVAVPEFGLGLSPAPEYAEVAEALDVPVEEKVLSELLTSPGLKSDPVHPNAAGYRRMASAVVALLQREGAL